MTAYHGHWTRYTPDVLPEQAPANTIFWRRDDDGADWYAWSRANWQIIGGIDASGTVKVTTVNGVVSCISTDATGLTLGSEFDLYELAADAERPQHGWVVADGVFSAPPEPEPAPLEDPVSAPTADQIRAALRAGGKTDVQIDALFALAAATL